MGEYTAYVARMAAGFFLVFMAFNTTQALETTLISDKTLGYLTLGAIYGSFTITTIVAPKIVNILGPKVSMYLGAVPYVLLVFANIEPKYWLLIPASAAVGVGAGILWTGQGIYMSRCAIREAKLTGESVDTVTSRLNSLFWTAFQFNGALGLIVSSIILQTVGSDQDKFKQAVQYMFTGFGALGCVGILILFSVKPVGGGSEDPRTPSGDEADTAALVLNGGPAEEEGPVGGLYRRGSSGGKVSGRGGGDSSSSGGGGDAGGSKDVSLYETLRLAASSRAMQLLLPIIFYCGFSLGFNTATFPLIYQDTDADASTGTPEHLRLLAKSTVGYQAATFYLVNSAASWAWGRLQPKVGRRALFVISAAATSGYYALVVLMTTGVLSPGHASPAAYALVFGAAVLFGVGDSVLESQIPAIIQSPTFFPAERDRDAANSNVRMWQSFGYCAQFGIGIPLSPTLQAAVLIPVFAVSMLSLWACDTFVRPIDSARGGDNKLSLQDEDEGGLRGARTPLAVDGDMEA